MLSHSPQLIDEIGLSLCHTISETHQSVRPEILNSLFSSVDEGKVFSWSKQNQVSQLIAHSIIEGTVNSNRFDTWKSIHDQSYQSMSAYFAELDQISETLKSVSIPLVALKNGGIARGIYPCPGCCPMGDIDVLVEKQHFRHAHEILLKNGYQLSVKPPLAPDDFLGAEAAGVAEYRKQLNIDIELELELHWRAATGRWIRPDQEPSTEELMARSIPIPGTAVRLLSPEDNLLQVSLHTAKHTYVRAPGFRLHLDVERIVHAYPNLDWKLFVNRVKTLQVKTAVYFSLFIPRELFSTPIPDWVPEALRPPRWKEQLIIRWLNRVGLFNPKERKFGKLGYILFNALLYDDLGGLFRSIFPDRTWMKTRYGFNQSLLLPWYHFRRLLDLALRRVNT